MLWEWHSPSVASFLAEEVADEPPDDAHDVELWDREDGEQPLVSPRLESPQRADLHNLLEEYGIITREELRLPSTAFTPALHL